MLRQIKGDSAKVAAIVAADPKMAETASSSTTKHTHVAAHAHGAPRHKLAMAAP